VSELWNRVGRFNGLFLRRRNIFADIAVTRFL